MAEEQNGDARRLSLSEARVKEIVENAVLKLQIKLSEQFALKEDVRLAAHKDDIRRAEERLNLLISREEAQDAKLESLEQDKAGRDAVTNFKRWLTGGAILGTCFMAIQVAITLWVVVHGK